LSINFERNSGRCTSDFDTKSTKFASCLSKYWRAFLSFLSEIRVESPSILTPDLPDLLLVLLNYGSLFYHFWAIFGSIYIQFWSTWGDDLWEYTTIFVQFSSYFQVLIIVIITNFVTYSGRFTFIFDFNFDHFEWWSMGIYHEFYAIFVIFLGIDHWDIHHFCCIFGSIHLKF